jgi:hypothetical protein
MPDKKFFLFIFRFLSTPIKPSSLIVPNCNLVPRVCLFAGYVVAWHYITREQAYSGNEIALRRNYDIRVFREWWCELLSPSTFNPKRCLRTRPQMHLCKTKLVKTTEN